MVRTPDGTTLLVAESYAGRISAFTICADGGLTARRTWAQFGTPTRSREWADLFAAYPVMPDGLALDAEGALWVADMAGRGIGRYAPGGERLDYVPTGDLSVYAVALGGDDRRTLYLCAAPPVSAGEPSPKPNASLLACRVGVPGAGLP